MVFLTSGMTLYSAADLYGVSDVRHDTSAADLYGFSDVRHDTSAADLYGVSASGMTLKLSRPVWL